MSERQAAFRIAVRKFGPFESAIASQWAAFEAEERTGLALDLVALDLHPLEGALFKTEGMRRGDWDVAFVATDWIAAMHAAGAAIDLAPSFAEAPPADFPGGWTDSLLRLQNIGGAILGTPYHDGPECLLYRKDIFDDPQLQALHRDRFGRALRPPQTWEELHQTARFLHDPERGLYGAVFAGFPDGHNAVYDFLLQLWTRGGELFDAAGKLRLDSPEACAALEFYRSIVTDRAAAHPRCAEMDSVQAGVAFAAGEAAMAINWFGFAAMAHAAPESKVRGLVDIARIPRGEGGTSVSLNVYWVLSVASGSPHVPIAVRFLRHCVTPAMDKLTTMAGAIGCRRSTWLDAEVNRNIPFYRRMEELHASAREIPQVDAWPAIAGIIDSLIVETIAGEAPVAELLQRAELAGQRILR